MELLFLDTEIAVLFCNLNYADGKQSGVLLSIYLGKGVKNLCLSSEIWLSRRPMLS